MRDDLLELFAALDAWMARANAGCLAEALSPLRPVTIRIIGQAALFAAELDLPLATTMDVDAIARWPDDRVRTALIELLEKQGKFLDPVAHEAWMPDETQFATLYSGHWVIVEFALPEYVLISKAKKAPVKNRVLLTDYLASGPSSLFLDLARRYDLDLDTLL